ncbi:MAG TPA: response regulator [Candidatus Baltobacteraceae bacterium]|jgi:two-component system cell cycle response regulator|nr:response regulator [Candidatus Baltobacteraceae bacterium]
MSTRVLVIEDNPTNLDLMTYLLRALGYEVATAPDGVSGLELARAEKYDVVLADILMPRMDGYEFARHFKTDPALQSTPLIAVTALAMAGDRERIVAAGFDDYISKPIDPQNLGPQIESVLSKAARG